MSVTLPPTGAGSPPDADELSPTTPRRDRRLRRLVVALVTAIAVIAALVTVLVWPDGDDDGAGTSSTTAAPTTVAATTEPPTVATTSPTTAQPTPVDTSTAVFPSGPQATGYDDPVEAARQFAVAFAGFTTPVVGPFMQGDARSGEVEVRASADGPVTTVMVRQLGEDGTWWVLGSATGTIVVDEPVAGATVTSPVTVSGQALAFEGAVSVEVRQDGTSVPLGVGQVLGGGDEMRPFSGTIEFTDPTADRGALVFLTYSAKDGSVLQAATLRVTFG